MSKETSIANEALTREHIETYLHAQYGPQTELLYLALLGQERQEDLKGYGYGRPLRVHFRHPNGQEDDIVLRTMSPDPFGHERRSDRAGNLMMCYDLFNNTPHRIRALDIGTFAEDGSLLSMAPGEAFFVTNYVEGELYAHDLSRMSQPTTKTNDEDIARARALAMYLVELHSEQADPSNYTRELRDTIGSGEGIFGLCDSYPLDHPIATQERLMALEQKAVAWRWKLKHMSHRCKRTHGDFHPFNILFREGTDFTMLDCSRGGVGEPADDLASMSLNYAFFALQHNTSFEGPLRDCWDIFWRTYLEHTHDDEVFGVVAPFFAWRALVMASPTWYPSIDEALRDRLLRFAERLLDGHPFHPEQIDEVLS